MAIMWASNGEIDFETARDYASKLVLLACTLRAGITDAWLKLPGIIKRAKPVRKEYDVAAFMNSMALMAEMFALTDLAQKSKQLITVFLE